MDPIDTLKAKIKKTLDLGDYKELRVLSKETETADLAEAFSDVSSAVCANLFRHVPRTKRADLFSYFELAKQEELIHLLSEVMVSTLLNEMEADNRTSLLEGLPVELREALLLKLNPEERQVAWKLLSYPEDSVGRLMTPDVLSLDPKMTVTQGLEFIHWSTSLPEEFLHTLFVTDKEGRLLGEVSLASLVMCDPPSSLILNIMRKPAVMLFPEQDGSEAVEAFRRYDRISIPIVDQEKKLLGIVTNDDVFDLAEEEATEDIQQFGGHGALEHSYFHTPLLEMLQKRIGWLVVLFIGAFFSCAALRGYEESLSKWSFLMFFLPIVTSTGGNSGTQAASLVIRGLAINELELSDIWRVLRKELSIGLVLGCVLASIGFLRVITWQMTAIVGLVVSLSVVSVVLLGVVVGSMLPFLFQKAKLDPAVVSSPFITTIMDMSGILIYINITLVMIKYFP